MLRDVAASSGTQGQGLALDPGTDDFLQAEVARVRLRNERWIAVIVGVATAVTVAISVAVALSGLPRLGTLLTGLALAFGAYYLFVVVPLLRRGRGLRVLRVVNVTLEVSVASVIALVDLRFMGPLYMLTTSAPLITFVAVAASGLRLSRRLAIYAGVLAAAEYLAVYALAHRALAPEVLASLRSLSPGWAAQHAIYLLLAGVIAAVVARTGRAMTARVASQLTERARVTRIFGEYVAPEAVERVLRGELSLGGERREVSILFADIRGFTTLSNHLEPEAVLGYLNRYFEPVCDAVTRHGGMVNKFMGDGLLAVFGAPEPDPDHARHAAAAALDMVAAAARVARPDGQPTRIGVGVHAGPVVLGSMGADRRRDYTVIGDTVNTASRIEGLTRELGAEVLVSAAVAEACGLATERVGPVRVKGRDEPVVVHRLVGRPARAAS